MAENVNPVAVGAVGVGLIFIWVGVKGGSVLKTAQSLIQGHQPTADMAYPVVTPMGGGSADSTTPSSTPSSDAQGGTAAQNQAIAKQLAASYGWDTGTQWDDLVKLWDRESGWNNRAVNRSSGATGIPQALPPTKLPKAGQAPTYAAGPQISWGLSYIKSRYGSPSAAWAHEQSAGWY